MNSRERVLCALSGEQPDRVPFCEGTVSQAVVCAMNGLPGPLSERQVSDALGRDVVMAHCLTPIFADCSRIPPYARPENLRAMIDAIQKYGVYPSGISSG